MLKSCTYCMRIHDSKHICIEKQAVIDKRHNWVRDNNSQVYKFRSSGAWQRKREEIRARDLQLCQICIRELYETTNKYTYNDLSVHHAVPLEEDYDKRLDNDNLITICDSHHEKAESGEIPMEVILQIIAEQEAK